jgi:uncharacterized membrane protein
MSAARPAPPTEGTPQSSTSLALDLAVARLLRAGTLGAVGIMTAGVVLMALAGRSPLDKPFPPFDLTRIPADVLALRPEGFLWLGLVAVILTPISRVGASLFGYLRSADRSMVLISLAILGVIAMSVVISVVDQ